MLPFPKRDGDWRMPCSCSAIVVNLSGRERRIKLQGKPALPGLLDVIANERVPAPGETVAMGPWQVRLLWPVP